MTSPRRLDDGVAAWPLFDAATCRRLEADAATSLPAHALMARAGLALARLARALVPHGRRAWIAAGPGNNGGDGLVAARHLQAAGWQVVVTLCADAGRLPPDAAWAWRAAQAAGLDLRDTLPSPEELAAQDLAIDALLGLGASRAPARAIAAAVQALNAGPAPVLAVDVPTGLSSDTGAVLGTANPGPARACVTARWTLVLLAPKPGLFTGTGRAVAGQLWFDGLGVPLDAHPPQAWLAGVDAARTLAVPRGAAAHKGSFGDVHVVGGAPGMAGAARLCARAAAHAGAGRVFVHPLGRQGSAPGLDDRQPELMIRTPAPRPQSGDAATWVVGCGGGEPVRRWLATGLAGAARLVLDADALNAVAASPSLQAALRARAGHGRATILTPHPLEAARLLGATTAQVQADRLGAARALAGRTGACVVLKGSGTVLALPGGVPWINPTGNARLATAGTGDVLAGWIGGAWSAASGDAAAGGGNVTVEAGAAGEVALQAALAATWRHGRAADEAPGDPALPWLASELVEAMTAVLPPHGTPVPA